MTGYHQLTQKQRYQLEALLANRCNQAVAAQKLQVHPSTISRELARNGYASQGREYDAAEAQRRYEARRIEKGRSSRKIRGPLQELVETKLRLGWSPEQICGRLWHERAVQLSHETIYQHVIRDARQKGTLRYSLRNGGYGYRRLRKSAHVRLPRSPRRRSIAERPAAVEQRREIGHWERDLVHSQQNRAALLLMTERASRYVQIRWLDRITMRGVADSTATTLRNFHVRSLTNDNGSEFNGADELESRLETPIYFTDPGAPWQRGTVENTAGLLRQYFHKRTRYQPAHSWLAPAMQHTLNTRPRKCLGYRTPHEVLFRHKLALFSRHWMHFGLEITSPS